MTDEEKTGEIINNFLRQRKFYFSDLDMARDLIKIALTEGRKELEQWKQEWQDVQMQANEEGFARTILQIKYAELSNLVTELTDSKTELENKVTELEKQIEKMKCCGNCSKRNQCEMNVIDSLHCDKWS